MTFASRNVNAAAIPSGFISTTLSPLADFNTVYIGPTGTYWASGLESGAYYLYRSTNSGDSWQRTATSIINAPVSAIWQSTSGSVVYLGVIDNTTLRGVWVSTDSGSTFEQITLPVSGNIYSLQEFNGYVYAGGPNSYRFTLTGAYHDQLDLRNNGFLINVWAMTRFGGSLILASNPTTVQSEGVYSLSPEGVLTPLVGAGAFIAVATSPSLIAAATISPSFSSQHGVLVGNETSLATSGLYAPGIPFNSLAYGGIFVGAGQNGYHGADDWGLWYSSNGTTWTRSAVTQFARSVSFGGGVYLAGITGGIYKSTNGINWTSCATGCPQALVVPSVTQSAWGDYNPATNTYPVTLTASPTGGTGTYSYLWSTSSVVYTTELNVIAGQAVTGTVTVTSGSQNQVINWSVTAPTAPSG
ncbi:MAG TPA: hypothetical protein VFK94_03475, partial [Patescibacteria group bacterium]|nr:hypothetical protein [Patescibacteria group bacterium]